MEKEKRKVDSSKRGYRRGKEKRDRGYEAESIFIGEASRRRKKKAG